MEDILVNIGGKLVDTSLTLSVFALIFWLIFKGGFIPKSYLGYTERKLLQEREHWIKLLEDVRSQSQREVGRARDTYEKRYFDLVEQYNRDRENWSKQYIDLLQKRVEQREQQLQTFVSMLRDYQNTQDRLAKILRDEGEQR
jgi:hypothetical protein